MGEPKAPLVERAGDGARGEPKALSVTRGLLGDLNAHTKGE